MRESFHPECEFSLSIQLCVTHIHAQHPFSVAHTCLIVRVFANADGITSIPSLLCRKNSTARKSQSLQMAAVAA